MARRFAMAAVTTPTGFIIGIVEEGLPGYVPDPREPVFPTWVAADKRAVALNEALGLTPGDAWGIVADSIRISLAPRNGKWTSRA